MTGEAKIGITVIGDLTTGPELRFTPGGSAVVSFTIASTPGTSGAPAREGQDPETLFLSASVRGGAAEHAAETLTQGMRVIATGALTSRSDGTGTGEARTVVELDVEEIAPSLRHATAAVTRTGAGPRGDPAPAPDDAFSLSARDYADAERWFGLEANPDGRINTGTQGASGG